MLLELADLTTDEEGRHIRLDEMARYIRNTYGKNSDEYQKFMKRLTLIQDKFPAEIAMPIKEYFDHLAGGKYREVRRMDANFLGTLFEADDAAAMDFEFDDHSDFDFEVDE